MELYWLISQEARVGLIEYQYRRHRTKLAMAGMKAPWELPSPLPVIPVHAGMDEKELQKFMSEAPHSPEKVD